MQHAANTITISIVEELDKRVIVNSQHSADSMTATADCISRKVSEMAFHLSHEDNIIALIEPPKLLMTRQAMQGRSIKTRLQKLILVYL